MDYAKHYLALIERAKTRVLDGCIERHHVIPRCVGGSDDPSNIVALTPEEHYMAHQILIKLYPGVGDLIFAAIMMAKRCSNNKAYGWIRRKAYGFTVSTEKRARISAATRAAMKRPEVFARVSAARKGRSLTDEWKANVSAGGMGRVFSAEHRRNISLARAGRKFAPHSEETKRKMSLIRTGQKLTAEARAKLSAFHKGRKKGPLPTSTKAKLSAALKAHFAIARLQAADPIAASQAGDAVLAESQ